MGHPVKNSKKFKTQVQAALEARELEKARLLELKQNPPVRAFIEAINFGRVTAYRYVVGRPRVGRLVADFGMASRRDHAMACIDRMAERGLELGMADLNRCGGNLFFASNEDLYAAISFIDRVILRKGA